jgi:hypothetical protein
VARLELCDPSAEIHLEKEHRAVRGVNIYRKAIHTNPAFAIHSSLKTGGWVACVDTTCNEPDPGLLNRCLIGKR